MKILLINNNPVVSRLTALSARKEDIEIDEIQEVTELSSDKYDIVFVDADSWSKDVEDVISENINVQKRVLFYAQDDNQDINNFDISILKPFLPSEVSAVIRSVEESVVSAVDTTEIEEVEHFDALADSKNENREPLFDLEDTLAEVATLKSVDVATSAEKKDLMAELTKIDEGIVDDKNTFNQKLEEAFPLKSDSFEDELFEKIPEAAKVEDELDFKVELDESSLKSTDDLFEVDLDNDKLSLDDELFTEEPKTTEVSSTDDLLDFDFEKNEELDFESEKVVESKVEIETSKEEEKIEVIEKEEFTLNSVENEAIIDEPKTEVEEESAALVTKVLDQSEVANIKEILEDNNSGTMELSDLMTTNMPAMALSEVTSLDADNVAEEKVTKKKSKKEKEVSTIDSDVLLETLATLRVETLRELLAGATISINIKFPKAK